MAARASILSVYAHTQELYAEHDAAVVAVAVTRDSRTVASGQVWVGPGMRRTRARAIEDCLQAPMLHG